MDTDKIQHAVTEAAQARELAELRAENKRLKERVEELVRLGKGYIEISDEVLEDVFVNVELEYRFREKKEVFEQALKGDQK